MTVRWAVILGLVILVGMAVPATAADPHRILVTDQGFDPPTLQVKRGDTVEWVWVSGSHEIVDGSPEDPDNAGQLFDLTLDQSTPDQKISFTFDEVGTVSYYSRKNPSLIGTITITGATPVQLKTWGWLKSVYQGA
jgi:plastocyanin